VWRTTGGKHRYLLGDCDAVLADDIDAFRAAAFAAVTRYQQSSAELTLEALESEHALLSKRLENFGDLSEPMDIWSRLGIAEPVLLPMLEADVFMQRVASCRAGER
jgi:malonate decarboxylase beta subunit